MAQSPAQRQASRRARVKAANGRTVSVVLPREAVEILDGLTADGLTVTQVVTGLLLACAPEAETPRPAPTAGTPQEMTRDADGVFRLNGL